jgi:hypothetical protein
MSDDIDLAEVMGALFFQACDGAWPLEDCYEIGRAVVFYGGIAGWILQPIDDHPLLPTDGFIDFPADEARRRLR